MPSSPRPVDPPRPAAPADALAAAVADNVAWCAAVARSRGTAQRATPRTWATRRPMPVLFPSLVTTAPGAAVAEVVDALPPGPVAVKDAFADVDLAAAGFSLLLHGRWLVAPVPTTTGTATPSAGPRLRCARVRTPAQLSGFAAASVHTGLDWAALQADPAVDLVTVDGFGAGRWARRAQAVLSSGSAAVGISNVQLLAGGPGSEGPDDGEVADVWRALVRAARDRFPGRPVVGWEPVDDVAGPLAAGLLVAGPLRVWVRG